MFSGFAAGEGGGFVQGSRAPCLPIVCGLAPSLSREIRTADPLISSHLAGSGPMSPSGAVHVVFVFSLAE